MSHLVRATTFTCLIASAIVLAACGDRRQPAAPPVASSTVAAAPSESPASANRPAAKTVEKVAIEGLKTTPSGLQYKDLVEGTGPRPFMGATVKVNYVGKLANGTKFDSTEGQGPISFPIGKGRVIKGWEIGIGGGQEIDPMRVGGKRLLVIPPDLGYGSNAMGIIPPNSTLIFEVELLAAKSPSAFPR